MYVIYPADELINWLIAREYTSTASRATTPGQGSDTSVSPDAPAPPLGRAASNPPNNTGPINPSFLSNTARTTATPSQQPQPPTKPQHYRQRSIISESGSTSTTTITTTSSDTVPHLEHHLSKTTTTTSSTKKSPPIIPPPPAPPQVVIKPPRNKNKKNKTPSPLPIRTLFTNPFKRDKIYPHENVPSISPHHPSKDLTTTTTTSAVARPNSPRPGFTESGLSQIPDTFLNYRERNTSGNLQRLKFQVEKKVGFSDDKYYLNSNSISTGGGSSSGTTGGLHPSNPFLFPKSSGDLSETQNLLNQYPTHLSGGGGGGGRPSAISNSKMNSILGGSVGSGGMTSSGSQGANLMTDATSLKDLLHPSLNETLKSHNALTFKLIRIVSDFTQQLSQQHEQHAVELQLLVDNFRKRNAELRKERPPCSSSLFQVWETLLQEVEIDSQAHSDLSGSLGRQVARPLLEKTFCKKIQSRKIFAHRESFETVLSKTEALLASTYRDYCDACMAHVQQGTSTSMANYLDAHNAYVLQLRGTNAMLKEYHNETLPALLQELDEIYIDLCNNLSDSILHGADLVASRMQETNRRYETLANVCRNVNGTADLRDLVKSMTVPAAPNQRHAFTQPVPLIPPTDGVEIPHLDKSHVPVLKDELLLERFSTPIARNRQEALRKEMIELESEMKQLQDSLDTLIRMQQRSLDSNLFNKANELQEEISMKRFDLRVAQMHLSALKAQTRTENTSKEDTVDGKSVVGGPSSSGGGESQKEKEKYLRERKMSVSSNATMKSKWMKAFRTLKGPQSGPSSPSKEVENETKSEQKKNQNQMFLAVTAIMMMRKNGKEKDKQSSGEAFQIFENHIFQEYTYKKITPCDICSQVLRGHTKQGLRCRLCKLNVHTDCQGKVSKCLPKTRLLRRQRSTSELETRLSQINNSDQPANAEEEATMKPGQVETLQRGDGRPTDEPDLIYQVLKQATDIKKTGGSSSGSGSGNGIHGSSQTLYSQHEIGIGPGVTVLASASARRSNPSVNVVGQSGGPASGATTPGAMGAAQALANQSSSSGRRSSEQRRDSYVSHKSISADPPGPTTPIYLVPPARPRCISLPETPQTPHSPRRRKLDLRMKSFSLDSPESTEHAQRRRYAHGSQSTSHSQYWRLSYYTDSTEDGMNEESSSQPPNDRHHHYNYGMVHSKSANVNPTHSSSSVSLKRASTPPSSLLTTSAHSDSLYSSTTNNASTTNDYNQLQSPSFASLNHFANNNASNYGRPQTHGYAPSSPVHNRRALLSTRNVRMSSVELPDENDKSLSSASTSPCPSPKPHRLLPTNLYVVLYMFKARHPDELDLKAGYKVTVTDTTDPDWWQGKCMGRVGYFPSKYVTKLQPGEKPLQVTHNLQVTDGAENGLKLLRDQIVIQIGEELDGMVTIRNGENKQGICPLKYLQEV